MMKQALLALAGAAMVGLVSTASAQTVPDYNFESPNLGGSFLYAPNLNVPGVTFANNAGIAGSTFGPAASDGQYGFVQSGGGPDGLGLGSISFAVTDLSPGMTYNVSFSAAMRPGYLANPIAVLFDSMPIGLFTPTSTDGFTLFTTLDFMAAGSAGTLQFVGTAVGGDLDSAIDTVVFNAEPAQGAVPEPATWALMILGMGAVGFAMRRRKGATRVSFAV